MKSSFCIDLQRFMLIPTKFPLSLCRLVNATRSDDNPNGFTIEGFTIVENRDISTVER